MTTRASDLSADDALLTQAMALHQAGRLDDAETRYRTLLAQTPGHAFAWHLLGVIGYQRGDYADGERAVRRAIAIDGRVAAFHANLANLLKAQGRREEAIASYMTALHLDPGNAETHNNLGNAHRDGGRHAEAEASYRRALAIAPRAVGVEINLGATLVAQGRATESAAVLERCVRLAPGDALAWYNLGLARAALDDVRGAAEASRRAATIEPRLADAHYNLGNALAEMGSIADAAVAFQQALAQQPDHAAAAFNLGNMLAAGNLQEEAAACYRRAIEIRSDHAAAYYGLGNALHELGRPAEATAAYETALALDPTSFKAWHMKGSALYRMGRIEEALAANRRARESAPERASVLSNELLMSNYLDADASEDLLKRHREYDERYRHVAEQQVRDVRPPRVAGRLRVGYVSPDLRRHSVAYFLEPVLEHYDRERFEVHCYATNGAVDEVSERLRARVDGWVQAERLTDEELAARVRADGIDILVDLAGHTSGNRLLAFARRAAPVQVTWLGYPTTTGLSAMDYRITDWEVDPAGYEAFNAERPLRLPGSYFCYRPYERAPQVAPLPALRSGTVTFGSFNNFAKVSPAVLALWAQVLQAVPGSRLLLKARSLADAQVRQALLERLGAQGIEGERIDLRGWEAEVGGQLALYGEVDIGLDTWPYNGATTTCEALWMGVPVVSLSGATHASRMGRSILKAAGLAHCVADTPEAYVRAAVALAGDLDALARLRAGLRERLRASPLTDEIAFTRRFEAALLSAMSSRVIAAVGSATHEAVVDASTGTASANVHEAAPPPGSVILGAGPANVRIVTPDSLANLTAYVLAEQGDWFEPELPFLRRVVQSGNQVLDIGANYGLYGLSLAPVIGPAGTVHAFEPSPRTAAHLRAGVASNGLRNVHVHELALSDHDGVAVLDVSGIAEAAHLTSCEAAGPGFASVRVLSLDQWWQATGTPQIDILKMDAEGEESRIIAGGRRFFAAVSPLVMVEIKHGVAQHLSLVTLLAEHGYAAYRLVPGLSILVPLNVGDPCDDYMLNAFCCKPDRARMLAERGLLIESDDDRHESFDAGVVELYRRATAADGTADARSRIAALREAHVRAGAAAAQRPTAARLGTFARIALAWGERSEAVAALQRILKGEALEGDAGELFLSPSARFDTLSARGDQQRWFSAAVLEAYEESRSFSSYFTAPESQGLIRAFDALGFPGESMRRRAALVAALGRMRPGESVRLSDALPQLQGLP